MKRFIILMTAMLAVLIAAGCGSAETGIREEGQENSQEILPASAEETAPGEMEYADEFPAAYHSVIEKYRAARAEDIRAVEILRFDVSEFAVPTDIDGNALDLGCALIDLDGDGIEEMIIAGFGTDDFGLKSIYDLYTLMDGQPRRLMMGWYRSRLYLTASNEIYNMGFNGADKAADYVYRMEDGELILEEGFLSKWDREEKAIVWYYTTDEDYDFSNDTRIDTEEAKARIAEYESSTYLPPLIKID